MHLDGLDGEKQRLCDLGVGRAIGRQSGDPPLARRQRVGPRLLLAAHADAACAQLVAGGLGERVGAARTRELVALAQWRAAVAAAAGTAQQRAE